MRTIYVWLKKETLRMNFFRRLSGSSSSKRRRSDTVCTQEQCHEFEDVQQEPNHNSERRSRSLSLGTIFSRNRCRQPSSEHYTIDFWSRNFADKNQITWLEFRAAFVLDYKHSLEEFWDKGRLSSVLDMARDQLCNKESVVHITRYRRFVGSDSKPDAIWNKIREEATRLLFEEAVENSLCL